MANTTSRAKAIRDMCKQCIYDPVAGKGTWRQQVEACTSKDCPLYHFRPVSSGKQVDQEN